MATGKTFYILDEPTTGLHFEDVKKKLLAVLERLVSAGNTVYVIEHSTDVIEAADWIIDLGPNGGPDGGEIMAYGTRGYRQRPASETGRYLKSLLNNKRVKKTVSPFLERLENALFIISSD